MYSGLEMEIRASMDRAEWNGTSSSYQVTPDISLLLERIIINSDTFMTKILIRRVLGILQKLPLVYSIPYF